MILKPDVNYDMFMVVAKAGTRPDIEPGGIVGICTMMNLREIGERVATNRQEAKELVFTSALACVYKWLRDLDAENDRETQQQQAALQPQDQES